LPLRRLRESLTKGNLWLYIFALLRERPRYPYKIADLIEERFGWKPARVTTYIVLKRLQAEGYVRVAVRVNERGRTRHYYVLTEKGEELFEEARRLMREVYSSLFGGEIDAPE